MAKDEVSLTVFNVPSTFLNTTPALPYSLDEKRPMPLVRQALGLEAREAAGDQGDVAGSPDGRIPAGRASIWSGDTPLRAFPSEAVDLTGRGVHCIIVPPSALVIKRPADDPEESEPEPKKQHLPPSTSNETAIYQSDIRERIVERAALVLAALANLQTEIFRPEFSYAVPVPSPHLTNMGEFLIKSDEGAGRHVLKSILRTVRQEYCSECGVEIGLFSTQGAGRARLATATAALLLESGVPAVFIPLSSTRHRTSEIRDSLVLALKAAGRTDAIDALFDSCCRHPEGRLGLVKFCNHLASTRQKLVFVMLGYDLLDDEDTTTFRSITSGHVVLFTAGANSELRRQVEARVAEGRRSYRAVYVNSGLPDDDFQGWLQNFSTEANILFGQEDVEALETTTGRTPSE
ncbi:hypothetical protein DFH07DRAFT_1061257 [Mycena maculata]|uniref:Uncharacterized protein n=1 Tax=Mycena maculata TaxID=230809 RepID=A0AAD7J0B1_9AGAR|nr:hypothetical protein DFH07DRAFT_1061257 [Mycena maculata]